MTEENAPGARYGPDTSEVVSAAASALFLGYSAPMPGGDSRYSDGTVAHETRLLGVSAIAEPLSRAANCGVGETVLEEVLGSRFVTGYADFRAAAYLTPLARAVLLGEPL